LKEQGVERGIAVPLYNFGPGVRWVVKYTPRAVYPGKSRATHFIGSLMVLGACLDGCGKSYPYWGSNP